MISKLLHNKHLRIFTGVFGTFLMAFSLNVLVVPQGLYSGGLYGVCQVIRTLLAQTFGVSFESVDIAGIMYYLLNIPVFILAQKSFGKDFVIRLFITLTSYSLFASIIPSPSTPIIADPLTSCLVGGMLVGFGSGLVLTCGCSTGGLDVIGLYLSKIGSEFTVGKFSIWFNFVLYTACAFLFSLDTALYSIIYTVFTSLFLDRIHQQNITVQMMIFTKDKSQEIQQEILHRLARGVTFWNGCGAFTGEDVVVICVYVSKYEITTVRQIISTIDPHAFVTVQEGVHTYGLFQKHLM